MWLPVGREDFASCPRLLGNFLSSFEIRDLGRHALFDFVYMPTHRQRRKVDAVMNCSRVRVCVRVCVCVRVHYPMVPIWEGQLRPLQKQQLLPGAFPCSTVETFGIGQLFVMRTYEYTIRLNR